MAQRSIYIFILNIARTSDKTFVQMTFSADMYYLVFLQKFWEQFAYGIVDGNSAKTSADDHDDRFGGGKSCEV